MKHTKLIGKVLLILLIILSIGFNAYFLVQGYRARLINAGADAMLQSVMNNVKQNGFVTISIPPESITLVPKDSEKE